MFVLLATISQRVKVVVADQYTNMSNRWSCSSLEVGYQHVMGDMSADDNLKDEEQKLLMEIQAGPGDNLLFHSIFCSSCPGTTLLEEIQKQLGVTTIETSPAQTSKKSTNLRLLIFILPVLPSIALPSMPSRSLRMP